MGYECKVLADSIASDVRLTTLQVTFPRIVLAEFNTHRVFSRNSASSRAIPVEKNIARVLEDSFVPEAFAMNKRGMQAGEELDERDNSKARDAWLRGRDAAVLQASALADLGVHKQWANRLLEPYAWHQCIVTATEWENFFALRCNPMAAPEIRRIAEMMREHISWSDPQPLEPGQWHLPLVQMTETHGNGDLYDFAGGPAGMEKIVKISVARCARVSYLTHDGKRDIDADLALYDRLKTSGHMSPFEHAAYVGRFVVEDVKVASNFRFPWIQHRKQIEGEAVFRG